MRTLSFLLSTLFTITLAGRMMVPEGRLPGDMGYMLGTQVECDDFFCQMSHLSLLNYTFPPPAFNKGVIMSNFTASYPGGTTMFIGRYSAYDTNTGRYFIMTAMDGVGEQDYILYTIKVFNTPPAVTYAACTAAKNLVITSMQYDTVDNVLYAVFDSDIYTIDPTSCAIKQIGPLASNAEIAPGLTTTYDSNKHTYWIAIDDNIHGTHNLLSYNTRTQTSFTTPSLNNGDYWTLYGINYHPKLDQIVAITQNLRGYPSIKLVNYTSGQHVDLVPEYIWGDYDIEFDLWPQSPYTNQINWLDLDLNIFWFTTMWTDPESTAQDDALAYYNLTKGGVELGSGPMVIWENAIEFTNYVWFKWPNATY